ncbi:hypothetical protein HSR121_1753 [Halapricum desulfuricans]|uniref:Uncharacterized protein n=1 Tax=Halapricum desulfuricans TaxID=2841257 RepID=A0A897N1K1_9EURY|nr:hypothetical protein HSR121_1753 [Halapricum desulfuricans]
MDTNENVEPTYAKFILKTTEWGDIVEFFNAIIEIDRAGRKSMR